MVKKSSFGGYENNLRQLHVWTGHGGGGLRPGGLCEGDKEGRWAYMGAAVPECSSHLIHFLRMQLPLQHFRWLFLAFEIFIFQLLYFILLSSILTTYRTTFLPPAPTLEGLELYTLGAGRKYWTEFTTGDAHNIHAWLNSYHSFLWRKKINIAANCSRFSLVLYYSIFNRKTYWQDKDRDVVLFGRE